MIVIDYSFVIFQRESWNELVGGCFFGHYKAGMMRKLTP